jgi:hypothetical protein
MNKPQTLLDLFSTQAVQISLPLLVANLLLSALLAWILGRVYVKFGTTLSNREQFARNFLLVTTSTMLIFTIVKPSMALSRSSVSGPLSKSRRNSATCFSPFRWGWVLARSKRSSARSHLLSCS